MGVGYLRIREGIASAGITADWATESGPSLRGGISNKVTNVAPALESVIKSHPVTSQALAPNVHWELRVWLTRLRE